MHTWSDFSIGDHKCGAKTTKLRPLHGAMDLGACSSSLEINKNRRNVSQKCDGKAIQSSRRWKHDLLGSTMHEILSNRSIWDRKSGSEVT